ncbi:MAG: aspartate aminotransferase family protein [Parvibaculum sp.]|uniref:aspartate aminotransferase family protein n=1 Tax=Parvibaculum sp. TaxID=2024848 RepID=UPI0025F5915E|nr:aspartate aminotransferase family protein [Parvibaculum sp.]MCE9651005.1 aspartate aminotransferase family protein [Parvibaculum sp.]
MSADTAVEGIATPNDLESNWLPFTPNRQFKREPRLLARAKDVFYYKPDGTEVLDATAGLWCCNAGHCRDEVVQAIQHQAGELDFAPTFQFGHPKAFELASRITGLMPDDLDHVLFCNSGSEAADTALKIAIAFHRANGEASRTRLIGRERGYHGVGFGGISVGGMVANRKFFGPLLAGTDHLPHTYNRAEQAFTIGQPEWGAHLADELQRLVDLHDASTIAAVIVEPMSGSTGVLPPPKGYLQRLRELCTKHGILLIFDEVITGFGRLGYATAAERFGVTPDILTFAKGITSGTVPMGGAVVRKHIYEAFQTGPDHLIDLFHGYTYSGHPLAAAAGLATLDLYRKESLFDRSRALEPVFAEALMSLKDHKLVQDIRCIGLAGAVDLAPIEGLPGKRGFDAMRAAFHEENMMVRVSGDCIAFSPPLIIDKARIEEIFGRFRRVLDKVA